MGVPGSAAADEVDAVARWRDHVAAMMEFEFVGAASLERRRWDHKKHRVRATAHQCGSQRCRFENLGGLPIDLRAFDVHSTRDKKWNCAFIAGLDRHLDARYGTDRKPVVKRCVDAVVGHGDRLLRCGLAGLSGRARGKRGPCVEPGAARTIDELAHDDAWRGRIVVLDIEVLMFSAGESAENEALCARRHQALHQAKVEAGIDIAERGVPLLRQFGAAHRVLPGERLLLLLFGNVALEGCPRIIGEDEQSAVKVLVKIGGASKGRKREPLAAVRWDKQDFGVSGFHIGGEKSGGADAADLASKQQMAGSQIDAQVFAIDLEVVDAIAGLRVEAAFAKQPRHLGRGDSGAERSGRGYGKQRNEGSATGHTASLMRGAAGRDGGGPVVDLKSRNRALRSGYFEQIIARAIGVGGDAVRSKQFLTIPGDERSCGETGDGPARPVDDPEPHGEISCISGGALRRYTQPLDVFGGSPERGESADGITTHAGGRVVEHGTEAGEESRVVRLTHYPYCCGV